MTSLKSDIWHFLTFDELIGNEGKLMNKKGIKDFILLVSVLMLLKLEISKTQEL